MKRRNVLVKCLAAAPLAGIQVVKADTWNQEPQGNETKQFYALLNEARETFCGEEYARAYRLYEQALAQIPKGQSSSVLAEIEEYRKKLQVILSDAAKALPEHEAKVRADPNNADKRSWYTSWLDRMGLEEEVYAQCQTILKSPGGGEHELECWNLIGWYYYRRAKYREALTWLERVKPRSGVHEHVAMYVEKVEYCKALEARMLVYAELGMTREACETVRDYIPRYGRVPGRERRALQKLKIDADAMYIEHCRHAT